MLIALTRGAWDKWTDVRYVFDAFVLDTALRELTNDRAAVKIEPKAFEVLLHLVENRDRMVSKEELLAAVWEGRFISEAAMSSAIRSVRNALGDDGKRQLCVKTLHGQGFRFVAPVVEDSAARIPPLADRASSDEPPVQDIRFCHSADGPRIGYAVAGSGPFVTR